MFRASPWITYDPPTSESQHPQSADNDAEMDAPQISTLHDDGESPPSNASPARTGKFRVKLPVNEAKMGTKFITFNGKTGEEAAAAEEREEDEPDEDEEDELIDDEEDASTPAASGSGAAGVSSSSSAPAKSGTKRPSARIKSQARRKARLSGPSAAPSSAAPTTASSEAQSSPAKDVRDAAPSTEPSSAAPQTSLAVPAATSKKKAVPKGTTAAQRAPRKSAPKSKATTTTTPAGIPPPITDAGTAATEASESHAGTVPSSPVLAPADGHTSEPEPEPEPEHEPEPEPESAPPADGAPSSSVFAASATEPTTIEDIEGVPHPRYPLPTKPFQVQPPPKITTGYAPIIPLDRTKAKSRHWRPAHREIRGIAGGRWFARSWVGDKDSEFALATEAALALPKLPSLSISAPAAGTRTPGKRKPKGDALSTAASSRSASAAPEGPALSVPPQRSATKKSALSTAVVASDVDMDIDLAS